MEIITALVIAALAAIFISIPFFTRAKDGDSEVTGEYYAPNPRIERLKALDSRKEALLTAIKDIEFDYGLGKLSTEDFNELNRQYRIEAADVLKEMDSVGGQASQTSLLDELEREIKSQRHKGLAVYADEEIEKEILRAREAAWHIESGASNCPKCGSEYDRADIFCSKCGAKLNEDAESKHATSI